MGSAPWCGGRQCGGRGRQARVGGYGRRPTAWAPAQPPACSRCPHSAGAEPPPKPLPPPHPTCPPQARKPTRVVDFDDLASGRAVVARQAKHLGLRAGAEGAAEQSGGAAQRLLCGQVVDLGLRGGCCVQQASRSTQQQPACSGQSARDMAATSTRLRWVGCEVAAAQVPRQARRRGGPRRAREAPARAPARPHLRARAQQLAQAHAPPQLRPLLHREAGRQQDGKHAGSVVLLQVLGHRLAPRRAGRPAGSRPPPLLPLLRCRRRRRCGLGAICGLWSCRCCWCCCVCGLAVAGCEGGEGCRLRAMLEPCICRRRRQLAAASGRGGRLSCTHRLHLSLIPSSQAKPQAAPTAAGAGLKPPARRRARAIAGAHHIDHGACLPSETAPAVTALPLGSAPTVGAAGPSKGPGMLLQ